STRRRDRRPPHGYDSLSRRQGADAPADGGREKRSRRRHSPANAHISSRGDCRCLRTVRRSPGWSLESSDQALVRLAWSLIISCLVSDYLLGEVAQCFG